MLSFHHTFSFILVAFLLSCQPSGKDKMMVEFENIQRYILNADYDSIVPLLDEESRDFFNEITIEENLTFDKAVQIGEKYKVKYLSVAFVASFANRMKKEKRTDDYFKFLAQEGVSFFSYFKWYTVNYKQSRIGKENYVAIFYREMEKNILSWVRFSLEEDRYKYDLMYTLRFYEMEFKRNHEFHLKDKSAEGIGENLQVVYNTLKKDYYNLDEDHELENNRRKRKNEMLGTRSK